MQADKKLAAAIHPKSTKRERSSAPAIEGLASGQPGAGKSCAEEKQIMRYLFLSLVLTLLLSMGASLPAAAQGSEGGCAQVGWWAGPRPKADDRSVRRHHPRHARAKYGRSYVETTPRRRFHRHGASPSRDAQ